MSSITIDYAGVEGTGASLGRAGVHTLIADRPDGKAGGTGLGFNGAELLALSIGGCFCNDVHYSANELGLSVSRLKVEVTVQLVGEPLLVSSAVISTECELADGRGTVELLERARARCTIANSLRNGVNVAFNWTSTS